MDGGSLRKGLAGSMWPLTPDCSTINYHEYISASVKAALNLLRTANLKMLGNWTDFLHRGLRREEAEEGSHAVLNRISSSSFSANQISCFLLRI